MRETVLDLGSTSENDEDEDEEENIFDDEIQMWIDAGNNLTN